MKFVYKKTFGSVVTPIIPIGIHSNHGYFQTTALIDSGSHFNIFDSQIGDALGIEVNKGKKQNVYGVVGKETAVYFHTVTLEIKDYKYETEVGFMKNNNF